MKNKTQIFIDELVSIQTSKILSIEILGSRKGENDITISDIDFLIICKRKKDANSVFEIALHAQEKIFKIKPTKINRVIQKFFLGSNNYCGIHLIILGRDEFDDNFRPVSFRLRFMTKLVGRNLFLHEMRRNHHLLYGKNLFDEIRIEHPGFSEKLACFLFPSIILLFLLPTLLFSRRTFKIWCFKAIKYHNISLRAYAKIAGLEYVFNDTLFNTAKIFRYKPDEYLNNPIILYTQAYRHIFGNLSFLWKT